VAWRRSVVVPVAGSDGGRGFGSILLPEGVRTVLPPLPPLKSFSYPSFRSEGGPAGVSDLVHRLPHSFGKPGGIGVFASVVYRQEFADLPITILCLFPGDDPVLTFRAEERAAQIEGSAKGIGATHHTARPR